MFSIKPAFGETAPINAARSICGLVNENTPNFSSVLRNGVFSASVN